MLNATLTSVEISIVSKRHFYPILSHCGDFEFNDKIKPAHKQQTPIAAANQGGLAGE